MLTVDSDAVVLALAWVLRFPNIANEYGLTYVVLFVRLDRHGVDFVNHRNLAIGIHVVVFRSDAHVTGGENQVRFIYRAHPVHHGELLSFKFDRIDINLDLPILAAVRLRHGSAGNVGDLIPYLKLRQIFEPRLVETLTFQCDQTHRKIRSVELQHHRRQGSRRKPSQIRHGQIRDIADRGVRVRTRLKVDLDQAHPGQRSRLDMIDSASQRKEALVAICDIRFDLLRRHARVKGRDHDNRDINLRKQIDGHTRNGGDTHDDDHETKHQDEERMLDGKRGHYSLTSCAAVGINAGGGDTTSPG